MDSSSPSSTSDSPLRRDDSIVLSPDLFPGLTSIRHLAVDIGGTLSKLCYLKGGRRPSSRNSSEQNLVLMGLNTEGEDTVGGRLHFMKFETKHLEKLLEFIVKELLSLGKNLQLQTVMATGGGGYKFFDLFEQKLNLKVQRVDEMEALITGCSFVLNNVRDELFTFQKDLPVPKQFVERTDPRIDPLFPFLLINIGSGVSMVKVDSPTKFTRVGGTSLGGGTFWGLCSLITQAKTFDEALELCNTGDGRNVDLLVKDIYGGSYDKIGLSGDAIASSFGKAMRVSNTPHQNFSDEDKAKALLHMISNNIGQIAFLTANRHNISRLIFAGFFIRGHPLTMHSISYAINYWSQGKSSAMFLRHEGYLGVIGAFLKNLDTSALAWQETFAHSTHSEPVFEQLQRQLSLFPVLSQAPPYTPDTVDLLLDGAARNYWLGVFRRKIGTTAERLRAMYGDTDEVTSRIESCSMSLTKLLDTFEQDPATYGKLSFRLLISLHLDCISESQFPDSYLSLKQRDNDIAISGVAAWYKEIDNAPDHASRYRKIVEGLLAGNMFDWEAEALEQFLKDAPASSIFTEARNKLGKPQKRSNVEEWVAHMLTRPAYKKAIIFADNCGPDFVMGVLGLARELLRNGTSVVIGVNSTPTLNDVCIVDALAVVPRVAAVDSIIKDGFDSGRLQIMETGSDSPCLDLTRVDAKLCQAAQDTDLLVLVGMGRAMHTNLNARFTCDSIKVGVLKSEFVAGQMDADLYDTLFIFERKV